MTTRIKNLSGEALPFAVGGTPGEPKIETIAPGETKSLPIKSDDPRLVGLAHAGTIELDIRTRALAKTADPAS